MENQLIINGLYNRVAYCEAQGLAKCFQAYADYARGEYILDIGFNENSGYTYIALENGITIGSHLGADIEYIVINSECGTESFSFTYEEAEQELQKLYA